MQVGDFGDFGDEALEPIGSIAPMANPERRDAADDELDSNEHPLFEIARPFHRDANKAREQVAPPTSSGRAKR